ncbi:hypothetical protein N7467_012328 [Penicillium canescens]|nr:hypothetical protein N7467_012328 [Penicillium canescens]
MSITCLPVELISNICGHLQLFERQALRLSCHALYEISSEEFFDQYFKKICFIATSGSLCELEALAQSDAICGRVQELWMIPTVFEGLHNRTENNLFHLAVSSKSCQPVEGEELKTRYAIYKDMVADNTDLLKSEACGTRLSRCLERFTNLVSVGLAHYATSFLLDPRQDQVRFLGWRHLINRIDFRFNETTLEDVRGITHNIHEINALALSRLCEALGASKRRRKIRKLHTCNADFCGYLSPEISLTQAQYDNLLIALDGLEDLHVCLAFNTLAGSTVRNPANVLNDRTWLNMIVKVAPRLEKLTLSQDYTHGQGVRPDYIWELSQRMKFTRIKELHLHQAHVTSAGLRSLLSEAKATLTTFTLFEVRLVDDVTADYDIGPAESLSSYSPAPYSPAPDPPVSPPPVSSPRAVELPGPCCFKGSQSSGPPAPDAPGTSPTPSDHSPGPPHGSSLESEEVIWKRLWEFFGKNLLLHRFSMSLLTCGGESAIEFQEIDDLSKLREHVVFDAGKTHHSFSQWIDRLSPVEFPGIPAFQRPSERGCKWIPSV